MRPQTSFIPNPLLRGGHAQTLAGFLLGSPPQPQPAEQLAITFDDGDRTTIDLDLPASQHAEAPVVVLFHGLNGCSESSYALRMSAKLRSLGIRAARYNHRGCGIGAEQLARGIYHSGSMNDLALALKIVAARFPAAPLYALGFSLSGTILLNMLGQHDVKATIPQLKAAAAICPPVDLEQSSVQLSRLQNAIYDQYFTNFLKKRVRRRRRFFPDVDPVAFPRFMNLRDFDEIFTAPFGGFKDRLDYYTQCSPKLYTQQIELPTLLLGAADDPVVAPAMYDTLEISDAMSVRIEKSGGHMGFLSKARTRFGDFRWMDDVLITWLEQQFAQAS